MKTLTKLTAEQTLRVKSEINQCNMKVLKEMAYSADLRNYDRIDELNNHISKLNKMIENGWQSPQF